MTVENEDMTPTSTPTESFDVIVVGGGRPPPTTITSKDSVGVEVGVISSFSTVTDWDWLLCGCLALLMFIERVINSLKYFE